MLGPKSNPWNPWNRIRASSLTTSASRSSLVRLGLLLPVEVDVEVLVGVDAADFVESRRPNVAANHQELLGAVARLRAVQLRVHKVHPQLGIEKKKVAVSIDM